MANDALKHDKDKIVQLMQRFDARWTKAASGFRKSADKAYGSRAGGGGGREGGPAGHARPDLDHVRRGATGAGAPTRT